MTDIVKKNSAEIEAIEKIAVVSQPFIMALMGSKISVMEKVDAGNSIYEILKVAEFDSGLTKLHDDDIIVLAKTTYDLILISYPNLTIEEFKTACKNGVLNTEWYGICLKSVATWIRVYLNTEGRVKAIKEWHSKIDVKKSDVPVAVKMEYNKKSALNSFERYKQSGNMPLGAFAYYDLINEIIGVEYKGIKTLVPDPVERRRIQREVRDRHTKAAMEEKEFSERRGNFEVANNIMSSVLDGFKGKLDHAIKTEMLKYFFDNLIKNNKPLNL